MLLTTESFMLAVVGLAVNLASPGQKGVRKFPVPATVLAATATLALALAALGALLAWLDIYAGGSIRPYPDSLLAAIVLLIILVQPTLAVMVAMGMRFEE